MDNKPFTTDHRAYVGNKEYYDIEAGIQFSLLFLHGMRQEHKLLEIGCGSLRAARLFIPYLNASCYRAVEPNKWLVEAGIENELGWDIIDIKKPIFFGFDDWDFSQIGEKFDFIMAQSIFSHAQNELVECALRTIKAVMHDETKFFFTFIPGSHGDCLGDRWMYPETIGYPLDYFQKKAEELEMHHQFIPWLHPHPHRWNLYTLKPLEPDDRWFTECPAGLAQLTLCKEGNPRLPCYEKEEL